jgi:hypothetical protein
VLSRLTFGFLFVSSMKVGSTLRLPLPFGGEVDDGETGGVGREVDMPFVRIDLRGAEAAGRLT